MHQINSYPHSFSLKILNAGSYLQSFLSTKCFKSLGWTLSRNIFTQGSPVNDDIFSRSLASRTSQQSRVRGGAHCILSRDIYHLSTHISTFTRTFLPLASEGSSTFYFSMVLRFELGASHLLGNCSNTWATPPVLCALFFRKGLELLAQG
jgi:hypothetical protein